MLITQYTLLTANSFQLAGGKTQKKEKGSDASLAHARDKSCKPPRICDLQGLSVVNTLLSFAQSQSNPVEQCCSQAHKFKTHFTRGGEEEDKMARTYDYSVTIEKRNDGKYRDRRLVELVHANKGAGVQWQYPSYGYLDYTDDVNAEAVTLGIAPGEIEWERDELHPPHTITAWYAVPAERVSEWVEKFYPRIDCTAGGCEWGTTCPFRTPILNALYRTSAAKYMAEWEPVARKLGIIELPQTPGLPKKPFFSNLDHDAQHLVGKTVAEHIARFWREHPNITWKQIKNAWGKGGTVAEVHGIYYPTPDEHGGKFASEVMERVFPTVLPGRAVADENGAWWVIDDREAWPRVVRLDIPGCLDQTLAEDSLGREAIDAFFSALPSRWRHRVEAVYNDNLMLCCWIRGRISGAGLFRAHPAFFTEE